MKIVALTGRRVDCDECFVTESPEPTPPAQYRLTYGGIQLDLCVNHKIALVTLLTSGDVVGEAQHSDH